MNPRALAFIAEQLRLANDNMTVYMDHHPIEDPDSVVISRFLQLQYHIMAAMNLYIQHTVVCKTKWQLHTTDHVHHLFAQEDYDNTYRRLLLKLIFHVNGFTPSDDYDVYYMDFLSQCWVVFILDKPSYKDHASNLHNLSLNDVGLRIIYHYISDMKKEWQC